MKKRTGKLAMLCISALLFVQAMPVWAAGEPEIALKAGEIREGDTQVQVSCDITEAIEVTSGKLRIKYNSEQLTLTQSGQGAALSGALCEINDSLTGNKEEGEIVAAFASSRPLERDGSLIDLTFQVDESVKAGNVLEITVAAEELSGDNGNVEAEVKSLSVTVGAKAEPSPEPNPEPAPTPGEESQGSVKEPALSNKAPSNSSSGKSAKSAKTGDETNMLLPVLGIGMAGAVILAAGKKKKA